MLAADLGSFDGKAIENAFHSLDDSDRLITACVELGDYYSAVAHSDAVYRVLAHFRENPNEVPSYPLIVVDEYQDFNLLETSFIAQLAARSPVLIAGDDDQALYGFRQASPAYIRALASDPDFQRFELPYCSRCTAVVVRAVNTLVTRAQAEGLLRGRVAKAYEYFAPDKRADSAAYPAIVDVRCSVETNKAPYIARYVSEQIGRICADDIQESATRNYPTALVLGPKQFVQRVYERLRGEYANVFYKQRSQAEVDILDGYQILAGDPESNLGWRIIAHCAQDAEATRAVKTAIEKDVSIVRVMTGHYLTHHIRLTDIIRRLKNGVEVTDSERALIESELQRPINEIVLGTMFGDRDENADPTTEQLDLASPSIVCTTLTGSKGLSAGHIFIVGLNDLHLPRRREAISDTEVCSLLVGLSRTRKQVHLISCRRFGSQTLAPSIFLGWLRDHVKQVRVDKDYFLQ